MALDARYNSGAVRFPIRLQPRASRNEISGLQGGSLKIRLTAPPVEGAANEALLDFLADSLAVPRRAVTIVTGHASRNKIVEVTGVSLETVQRLAE